MKKWKAYATCITLFAVMAVVLFHEALFSGMALQGIDGNYSVRLMLKRNMADGAGGIWNPYYWLGMGNTLAVNTKLLFLKVFPEQWNLTVCFISVIVSAMTGMLLFLRRQKLDLVPAVFGAVLYGFAPHFITLAYPAHVDSFCLLGYIPWLFLLISYVTDRDVGVLRGAAAALAAGLVWGMILNEDVQRGIYVSVVAAVYTVYLLFASKGEKEGRLKLSVPLLGRLALVGVLLLLVFANNFSRQMGGARVQGRQAGVSENPEQKAKEQWAFATSWSFHPAELVDTVAPGYHGMVTGDPDRPYWGDRPVAHSNDSIGWFALMFALAGAVLGCRTKGYVRFFTVAAVVATLLAFGQYYPGRPLFGLWYQLPMMDKMRAPVKFMSVTAFAVPVVASYGIQRLIEAVRDANRKILMRWVIGFGVVFGLALMGWLSSALDSGDIAQAAQEKLGHPELAAKAASGAVRGLGMMSLYAGLGLGLLVAARFLKANARLMSGIVGAGFIVLAVLDLGLIDRFYVKRSLFSPKEFYARTELIEYLQQHAGEHRVSMSFKVMHNGNMAPLSIAAARGIYVTHQFPYFGIEMMESTPKSRMPADYDHYFKQTLSGMPRAQNADELVRQLIENQMDFWRMSNVKYVVTDGFLYGLSQQPLPVFEAMKKHPGLNLRFTGKGYGDRPTAVFEVADPLPRFALYSGETPELLKGDYAVPDTISKTPKAIDLQVVAGDSGLLVWSGRYTDAWIAELDGQAVEMVPVEGILSGIKVPPGSHRVSLRFAPKTGLRNVSIGALWLAAAVAVGLWFLTMFKGKRAD